MKVENLSKTYRTKGAPPVQALKGVSFTLPDTGMVFLLGRSGSGKSTLLHILSGLESFDAGDITYRAWICISCCPTCACMSARRSSSSPSFCSSTSSRRPSATSCSRWASCAPSARDFPRRSRSTREAQFYWGLPSSPCPPPSCRSGCSCSTPSPVCT